MQRSRAQETTITKETAERDGQDTPERDSHQLRAKRHPHHRVADEDGIVRDQRDHDNQHVQNNNPKPVPQVDQGKSQSPIDIKEANPNNVQVNVMDHGSTQLAYSNAYDLQSHTGEPTYALFGGWQTDKELGLIAVTHNEQETNAHITTEERDGRDLQTELTSRIEQAIERSQTQQATPTNHASPDERANTPEPDHQPENQPDQPPELQPGEPNNEPNIQQIIQEQQDRQQAWEQGISLGQDNDHGFGIE